MLTWRDMGGIQEMCPQRHAERHPDPTRSFEDSNTNFSATNYISAQLWLLLVFCWKGLKLAATSFGSAKTSRQQLQGAQLRLVVVSMMLLCTGQCLAQTCLCQQSMYCGLQGLTTTQAFENLPCNLATKMWVFNRSSEPCEVLQIVCIFIFGFVCVDFVARDRTMHHVNLARLLADDLCAQMRVCVYVCCFLSWWA